MHVCVRVHVYACFYVCNYMRIHVYVYVCMYVPSYSLVTHSLAYSHTYYTQLLLALQQQWDHINRQYQGMTHLVTLDTIGKRLRYVGT